MKRVLMSLVLAGVLLTQTLPAWAGCSYYTYMVNGHVISCTVCCVGNSCTTTCF